MFFFFLCPSILFRLFFFIPSDLFLLLFCFANCLPLYLRIIFSVCARMKFIFAWFKFHVPRSRLHFVFSHVPISYQFYCCCWLFAIYRVEFNFCFVNIHGFCFCLVQSVFFCLSFYTSLFSGSVYFPRGCVLFFVVIFWVFVKRDS